MDKPKSYECCYELPYKEVFMEVDNTDYHTEFTIFARGEVNGSVCLRQDDLKKLIVQLSSYVKEEEN